MKLDKKVVEKILELKRGGYLIDDIAERFGVTRGAVLKVFAKAKPSSAPKKHGAT